MFARQLSLRSAFATATVVAVSLALLVAAALVLLTSVLHRTTENAARAVESVRLAS